MPTQIHLTRYLGEPISALLKQPDYTKWKFERRIDKDLPDVEINYTSKESGLSVTCDHNERIASMFIYANRFDQALIDIPLSSGRSEVIALLGKPTRSGAAHVDPILGKYGPWDRFDDPRHSIHIQYEPDADKIKLVTLMRADVAP